MFNFSRINLSFSSTFPGKINIFKAKLKNKHFLSTPLKFKHFSRSVRTLLKFGEFKWNPCWLIVLANSFGTHYVLNKHEDFFTNMAHAQNHPRWCHIKATLWVWWIKMKFLLSYHINTLRPRQNGRHFTDYIFNCIFLNEKFLSKFHWSLFSRLQLTIFQHWFR